MEYLKPGKYINSDHPQVIDFAEGIVGEYRSTKDKAISLYYAIRDGFPYNPYMISFNPNYLKSSFLLQKKQGHCVDKASFMVACCRAVGIPARIGMAKVKNHIGTSRLEELLKSNILVPHGYADISINGQWVKATPAFNKTLCTKLGVSCLNFDGEQDSLFQPFSSDGNMFMEYLEDFGTFSDIPIAFYEEKMREEYPHIFESPYLDREYLFV